MKSVGVVVGILAVLGITWFVFFPRQDNRSQEPNTQISKVEPSSIPKSQSKYIEYSSGLLESNIEKNRIIFFYANWCPTCRPVDKEIRENESKIPEGFVVIRVNYNDDETDKEEKALAEKYGITYQHTFVEIDKSGEVIQIWNGGDLDNLLSKIAR